MYVYIQSEPGLWTVGFYDPTGKWHGDSDHDNRESAAQRVHYLNGGRQFPDHSGGAGGSKGQSLAEASEAESAGRRFVR